MSGNTRTTRIEADGGEPHRLHHGGGPIQPMISPLNQKLLNDAKHFKADFGSSASDATAKKCGTAANSTR
jgi:hypothetical protein